MDAGQQSTAPGICPGCGQSIDASAVYCPVCGRPNPALAGAVSGPASNASYATAPVQRADATMPPPLPAWADQPTTTGGMASLASGPALTPNQPVRSHKRRNVFTAVATLVIIGLIGSGAYWAYAAFASRTDSQLARYYPANTVAFASVDLVAAANNNFKINPADLVGEQASALQKATGLDWQKDVVPWVGQDLSVGVFPLASAQTGQAVTDPGSAMGVALLVQSRDDNAAKAALAKLNGHLKQQGTTIHSSSYKGFTLYGPSDGAASGSYGAGSGWVVIASNANAAHAVIDRINGSGDTLSDQQPFKDAISNQPSNTFSTYFVNLRQILNTVVPTRAPNGLASVSVPFIESYPVAGGYATWTTSGERSQLTLNAVRNPNIPDVSGDTTGFAALAPGDAVAYAGVGNLGKLIQAGIAQVGVGALGSSADPLKSAFGISASDPLAQQPAGLAAIQTKSGEPQSVFYLHVSSDASATQLITTIANAQHWTTKAVTVAGQPATAFYSSETTDHPFTTPPTPGANGDGTPVAGTTTATLHQVGVAMTLKNTLVIAPDNDTATVIAQVAQGSAASLASNATFQSMTKAAPSGAAATGYISAAALKQVIHSSGGSATASSALFSHFDALAFTLVWNNSMLQGTMDAQLHA